MSPSREPRALIGSLTDRPAAGVEFLAYAAGSVPPSRLSRVRRLLAGPLPQWPRSAAEVRHVAAIIQRLKLPEAQRNRLLDQAASVDERFRPYRTRSATLSGDGAASSRRTRGQKAAAEWMELPPRLRAGVLDELLSSLEAVLVPVPRASRKGTSRVGKSELIHQLAARADLTRGQASRVVEALFSVESGLIAEALRGGDKVQITGFGSFEAKHREVRTGRNPRTGKEIRIAAAKSPTFRGGRAFKDALSGLDWGAGAVPGAGGYASAPVGGGIARSSGGSRARDRGVGSSSSRRGATGAGSASSGGASAGGRSGGVRGARGGTRAGGRGSAGGVRAAAEPKRFTDVTVYRGELYPSDDLAAAERLPDDAPLVGDEPCTLGVAIRLRRRGIGAAQRARRAVKNPRKDKGTVAIYVLATSKSPAIEIDDSLAKVDWPYDQDSETALFRLRVKAAAGDMPSAASIEVRLYDAGLDLLDVVQVQDTVVPEGAGRTGPAGGPARSLSWPDGGGGVIEAVPDAPARLLSIHVREEGNGFQFEFLFRDPRGNELEIVVARDIRRKDLEILLRQVRDFWTGLVITNYAQNLSVTQATFTRYLGQLRTLGQRAWVALFGSGRADQAGASETLGQLLATTAPDEGSRIQVTYEQGIQDFVFPWSILYPAAEQGEVDPHLFWGVRYQIEQVTGGSRQDGLADEPIDVLFALDRSFGNAEAQEGLWKRYQADARGKMRVTSPISDERTLFDALIRKPPPHLLYFYCHGYACSGAPGLRPDGVQQLRRQLEAMEEDAAAREAFETLLSLTAKMGDESWIYIGNAEITESTLDLQDFFYKRRPVVFLNMCQSAELLPSMSGGLVRVFLEHNASAIVGTECPMTAVFANAFAEAVFQAWFTGDDIGTALWKARRHFLHGERRNPLGLAYTLYGRATARLGSGPLIAQPAAPGAISPDQ